MIKCPKPIWTLSAHLQSRIMLPLTVSSSILSFQVKGSYLHRICPPLTVRLIYKSLGWWMRVLKLRRTWVSIRKRKSCLFPLLKKWGWLYKRISAKKGKWLRNILNRNKLRKEEKAQKWWRCIQLSPNPNSLRIKVRRTLLKERESVTKIIVSLTINWLRIT